MKKILLLFVIVFTFCEGAFLFAQESRYEESEYYYFNVAIEKIFAHRLGYVILYRKGSTQMARTYLPIEWFYDTAGKAEVYTINAGKEWPSMSVYYKDGEFSHVRLRLRASRAHESWGVVPLNVNIDKFFQDVEEVKLEF